MKCYSQKTLKTKYKQLGLSEEAANLLREYFTAFSALYGILSLKDAYTIISLQNKDLVTKEQLYGFSDIEQRDNVVFYIVDIDEMYPERKRSYETREIVAQDLLALNEEDYFCLKEMQIGKPLYIPTKSVLLQYAEDLFYEKTPQALALEKYMTEKMNIRGDDLDDVMGAICFTLNEREFDFDFIADELERLKKRVTKKDMETIVDLTYKMSNNFRQRANRGYTPNELSQRFAEGKKFPLGGKK